MKFSHLLPSAFFVLNLISCKSQMTPAEKQMPKTSSETVNSTYPKNRADNGTVRLIEGENKFLKDKNLNVTFTKTVQDSRGPMNARCIWAGNATVEIELMTTASRPKKFQISTGDFKKSLVNSVIFSGYKISLEQLYPSNSTDMDAKKLKGKYVIDLKIEPTN